MKITIVVASLPAALTAAMSIVASKSPCLILSPTATLISNGSPFSSTVLIPMCTKISRPLSVRKPMACFVGETIVTSASIGAKILSSVGSIAKPSPIIFEANVSSWTCSKWSKDPFATAKKFSSLPAGVSSTALTSSADNGFSSLDDNSPL